MYKFLRNILFLFDPEAVHTFSMNVLRILCGIPFIKEIIARRYATSASPAKVSGLLFKNPIGLAAGFDKNAKYLFELETLGFGFVEIGTVTPLPQKGNGKPRLFRLSKDGALINRMGFNNDGVQIIANRLQKWKLRSGEGNAEFGSSNYKILIGGNIGKNKHTPNEDAWRDYEICFRELHELVDYFVINVSSPNTPGLRELQEEDLLRKIVSNLQNINRSLAKPKPLFLKIAPDLSKEQLDQIIDLAIELDLSGLVATNTTILREGLVTPPFDVESMGTGGLSGKPLKTMSTNIIRRIHLRTNGKLLVIGSGGIFTKEDAHEKFDAGASLIQVWTGFIYEGPSIVKNLCRSISGAVNPD